MTSLYSRLVHSFTNQRSVAEGNEPLGSLIREVLLLGCRMCELEIGTPNEIERLITQKVKQITSDVQFFEYKGATKEKVEYEGDANEAEENENVVGLNIYATDNEHGGLTYDDICHHLTAALADLRVEYKDEPDSEVYQELRATYTSGIEQARTPREGQSPHKMWMSIQTSAKKSIKKEQLLEEEKERRLYSAASAKRGRESHEQHGTRTKRSKLGTQGPSSILIEDSENEDNTFGEVAWDINSLEVLDMTRNYGKQVAKEIRRKRIKDGVTTGI